MTSYWSAVRKSESLQTYYLVGYSKELTSWWMAVIQYVGRKYIICQNVKSMYIYHNIRTIATYKIFAE